MSPEPKPDLVAYGLGGRIELYPGELRIMRDGLIGFVADLLKLGYGDMEKRVPFGQISSIEIVRPMVFPNFIRVSYAGSPPQTGRYFADAMAENSVILNPLDHRVFYDLQDRVFARKDEAPKNSDPVDPPDPTPAPAPAEAGSAETVAVSS